MEQFILRISDLLWKMRFKKTLESVPKAILVFIIFLLGYFSFDLNGNEEHYMLFAKQFMDPNWIHSRYMNEFPGTRLLYQIIIGFFLKYFSFETVLAGFRIILALLYAVSIVKIYKVLKFNNVQILLHLPVLFLMHQSLFAGSWMFISVEPKGFSYVFILFAFYYYIKTNYKIMIVFLIIATYFHILVGAYVFLFLMACLLFFESSKRRFSFIKLGLIYVLFLLPFIYYLRSAVIETDDFYPSVNWIYSYFRNPHHIGLFRDLSYFYSSHFYGILLAIIALIFSIYFYKINKDEHLKRLNNFVLLTLTGVLLAVIVAFFDTEGVLIKYYPFRINTVTTFVLMLILSSFIFSGLKPQYLKVWTHTAILISIVFLLKLSKPTFVNLHSHFTQNKYLALNKMGEYIKRNTKKDAVVLSFLGELSINRRIERDRFVVYKFIPANLKEIPEWYERELFKRKMAMDIDLLKDRKNDYRIDYLLAKHAINSDLLKLVHANEAYYLYKVIP